MIYEVCFSILNCDTMSLITNHVLTCLSSLLYKCNEMLVAIYLILLHNIIMEAIAQFTVVVRIAQLMPNNIKLKPDASLVITNATCINPNFHSKFILIHNVHCICVQCNLYVYYKLCYSL